MDDASYNLAPQTHDWNPQILSGVNGTWTYHYHVCIWCKAVGIRKKVSNRKAGIFPKTPYCGAGDATVAP